MDNYFWKQTSLQKNKLKLSFQKIKIMGTFIKEKGYFLFSWLIKQIP